jgi:hypothetical protein
MAATTDYHVIGQNSPLPKKDVTGKAFEALHVRIRLHASRTVFQAHMSADALLSQQTGVMRPGKPLRVKWQAHGRAW